MAAWQNIISPGREKYPSSNADTVNLGPATLAKQRERVKWVPPVTCSFVCTHDAHDHTIPSSSCKTNAVTLKTEKYS
ncbi:hypothetical protein V6N12_069981 [Hibiscus sabdariffa]|uniref:Uncharacterized protein n=1 Tax=Hibiscus sabdariffa TaxID=183260 RepID=A0ABR2FFK3_9ROSI